MPTAFADSGRVFFDIFKRNTKSPLLMKRSAILDYLFGFRRSEEKFATSKTHENAVRLGEALISGAGKPYAKKIMQSPITRFFSSIAHSLGATTLRTYGFTFLAFGLLTLLINFGESYFLGLSEIVMLPLVIGTIFSVIALPLFIFDIPIGRALCENALFDFIFFEFLCLKRAKYEADNSSPMPTLIGIFIGASCAAIGYFLPLEAVLAVLLAVLFSALSFSSPEFSFMATILALPYLQLLPHPTVTLALVCLVNVVSYFYKVLLGKRLYHLEIYDVIILIIMCFIFISGVFGGRDSFYSSLILIAIISVYFPAGNLIVNKRLADNACVLFMLSSVPAAIYGIVRYYIGGDFRPEWVDPALQGSITNRAVSLFGNPNIYAVYLIAAIILSLAYTLTRPHGRLLSAFCFFLNLYAMVLTFTRGAWLALLLTLGGLFVLKSIKTPKLLLIPLSLIPLSFFILPQKIIDRLLFSLGDSSASSRFSIWRSSLNMLRDNLITGVGIGEDSFIKGILPYLEDGVSAPHSHNLFLEIALEGGIFALIFFLLLLFVRLRHIASYSHYIKKSSVSAPILASACIIFAELAFGMTDYIFYNPAMCYLFFAFFGIGSATLRISRDESIHDYDDEKSKENATISIVVLKQK